MRSLLLTRITFIGKSLLWSLLLYMTAMLVVNWDELSHKKANNVVAVSSEAKVPLVISSASTSITAPAKSHISSILGMLGSLRTAMHQINKAAHFLVEN